MRIMKWAAVLITAGSIALAGCTTAPDELHDVAIEQCQEDLLDRAKDPESAQFDDMTANFAQGDDKTLYTYGVEGKFRGKNGFGGMALSQIMCLAIYDSESEEWEVTAYTY